MEIAKSIAGDAEIAEKAHKKSGEANIYDVKVGDIFSSSWGYEQTNSTFFQVIALVGKQSVRVREVWPETISRDPVSQMSEHRVYKLTNKILPPAPYASFIKDQENGDIKRIKPGHYQDKKEAKENCFFKLVIFAPISSNVLRLILFLMLSFI